MDFGKKIDDIIEDRNVRGILSGTISLGTGIGSYVCYNHNNIYGSGDYCAVSILFGISSILLFAKKI